MSLEDRLKLRAQRNKLPLAQLHSLRLEFALLLRHLLISEELGFRIALSQSVVSFTVFQLKVLGSLK